MKTKGDDVAYRDVSVDRGVSSASFQSGRCDILISSRKKEKKKKKEFAWRDRCVSDSAFQEKKKKKKRRVGGIKTGATACPSLL